MAADQQASRASGTRFTWSEGHHVGKGANNRSIDRTDLPLMARYGIAVIGLSRWTPQCWSYSRRHQWGHVVATLSGRGRWWFDGSWHESGPDSVFLSRPGAEFGARGVAANRWEFAAVLYAGDADRSVLDALPSPCLEAMSTGGIQRAVEGFFAELGGPANPRVLGCLTALVDAEAGRMITEPPQPRRLEGLWKAIEDDLSRPWTVEQMAGLMRMSAQHLRRICREETGLSPQAYLTRLRMVRAGQLLLAGKQPVDNIARLVGYDSQFSLSKAFKRHHRIGPREYRKRRGPA